MNVERKPIVSVESPDSEYPWYATEVDNGEVVVTEDKDGGRAAGLSNARTNVPDHVDLPDESAVSNSGDVVYAVTESGEFISLDPSMDPQKVPSLRAHLGFYDAESDTLELLEFVER